MTRHKSYVKEQAQRNEPITCNTFVLPSNVRNLAKKRVNELWQKHLKDPISVRMWVFKNPELVFFYLEHAPLDLNLLNQDETPFTLRIQTSWQSKMIANLRHGSCFSFDATFGTNQIKVCHHRPLSQFQHIVFL